MEGKNLVLLIVGSALLGGVGSSLSKEILTSRPESNSQIAMRNEQAPPPIASRAESGVWTWFDKKEFQAACGSSAIKKYATDKAAEKK